MHRRVWFLAAAVVAVLGLTGSAAAVTAGKSSSSSAQSLHAAPFATAMANIPRTPAARAAKKTMVFGLEQTVTGFNLGNADQNAFYAAIVAGTPVIRGTYIINNKGKYLLDMASKVKATKKSLTITIKKNANWNWLGHKAKPVTAADYIYTWKIITDPTSNVASAVGYSNIARAKAHGKKSVTFFWKKGQAFADYRDLFGYVYPGFALKGQKFNDYWHNCVCGNDGHPISNGPFYMSSYTQGQGMVLKKNPKWYGKKARLNSIAFKIITDTNSEIQAMRGGEVDAITPSPESALSTLVHQKNLVYSAVPSFTQEHWDIEVGPGGAPLLKKLYGGIAPGLKPLNNTFYEFGSPAGGKFAYFKKYDFNPKKAIAGLKSHGCTGGPSSPDKNNNKVWTCGGQKTEFHFDTTTRQSRVQSSQIFKQQLMAIGIKINVGIHDPADFFGTILPNAHFDLGEYAWIGGPDPSGFDAIYQCYDAAKNLGGSNYKRYCNKKVDKLIKKGEANFNSTKRTAQYQTAAKITSNAIAVIPLYAPPQIFVYKRALKGASKSNNPTSEGPTWNLQSWRVRVASSGL
jgi:peptide/nickel transport system substrate-binding protein